MDKKWSNKLKEVLIWFSAYANLVVFALVGGFAMTKSDCEDLKKTTKKAFIVTLIYYAVVAVLAIYSNCGYLFNDSFYATKAYDVYEMLTRIVSIAHIVVYAVFIILALVRKDGKDKEDKKETKEEKVEATTDAKEE